MATRLSVTIDLSDFNLQGRIQRIIDIFLRKVVEAMLQAIKRQMPYNQRSGRRPNPPFSKSGRAVRSLRYAKAGRRRYNVYAVDYLTDLRQAGWDWLTPAWRAVRSQLQRLLNEAIQESQ